MSHTSAAAADPFLAQQRPQVVAKDQPCGFNGLVGIERLFAGGRFAPRRNSIDVGFDQKYAAQFGGAEARLKRRAKAEMNFAERDFAESHSFLSVFLRIRETQPGNRSGRLEDIIGYLATSFEARDCVAFREPS